eukprot:6175770-Amphidinium_carterae.2
MASRHSQVSGCAKRVCAFVDRALIQGCANNREPQLAMRCSARAPGSLCQRQHRRMLADMGSVTTSCTKE